jgi:hypothetical protein
MKSNILHLLRLLCRLQMLQILLWCFHVAAKRAGAGHPRAEGGRADLRQRRGLDERLRGRVRGDLQLTTARAAPTTRKRPTTTSKRKKTFVAF